MKRLQRKDEIQEQATCVSEFRSKSNNHISIPFRGMTPRHARCKQKRRTLAASGAQKLPILNQLQLLHQLRAAGAQRLVLLHHAEPPRDFGVSLNHASEVLAEAVL